MDFAAFHGGNQKSACKVASGFEDRLPAHKTPYQSSCSCALLLQLRLQVSLPAFAHFTSVAMSGKGAKGLSGSGKGAKGTMGDKKGDKKKPVSRSARAGLQFPVGRIHRLLKVSDLRFQWKSLNIDC